MPVSFVVLALVAALAAPADDIDAVKSEDLRAGKDDAKRYFLIAPRKDAPAPKAGRGLVVVLPGGDGSAEFHPFVKRIALNALPDGVLVAQPVAVKWTEGQEVVWPTEKSPVEKMKFTTEDFVASVVLDVAARHLVDPARVFTLSWSSSGPAAYAISLADKTPVAGSFVAMSVFKPDQLPSLEKAKGHAYYLYHSPDDRVCPHRMAKRAAKDLAAAGAKVKLAEYDGGHGWRGDVFADVKAGVEWLEANAAGKRE